MVVGLCRALFQNIFARDNLDEEKLYQHSLLNGMGTNRKECWVHKEKEKRICARFRDSQKEEVRCFPAVENVRACSDQKIS